MSAIRPLILCVLDGWGIGAPGPGNAITPATAPHMLAWQQSYPFTKLDASEQAVGLPAGQMGNSEVGHLTIGAGMTLHQDSTRISEAISDGSFFGNDVLTGACRHVLARQSRLHLMGLLGPGGVHAQSEHLYALMRLARQQGVDRVFVHAFLDGRDTPPRSAREYMLGLQGQIEQLGVGKVATIAGRYYAMDRDQRWDRTALAYRALVYAEGPTAGDPVAAIEESYAHDVGDEFVAPTVITDGGAPVATIGARDAVIFYNYRTDRPRQLSEAFVLPDFDAFERGPRLDDLDFVTMTSYQEGLPVHVAFPPQHVTRPLARVVSDAGLTQFHTAETEKYAHVTFFINGGREEPFNGETRKLVPSPGVATYDLQPEMSAYGVTDGVIEAIDAGAYDLIVMNYANPDMVGHTGVLPAARKAVTVVDECLGRIVQALLPRGGGIAITGDHGNVEQMIDPQTGAPQTAHSTNPVPFVLVVPDDSPYRHAALRSGGSLANIAPTVLQILGLPQPVEMSATSLIE